MASRPPIPPLTDRVPIINNDGTPTSYFIRYLQERGIDISGKVTPEQVAQLIENWSAARAVNTGTGLAGGGTLNANLTLTLNAVLNDLNDVDTVTTPPTNGQTLVYDSVSGLWKPGAGGGGGGGGAPWALINSWDFAVSGAITERIVDISNYTDVLVVFDDVTTSASTWRVARFSLDGGITYVSTGTVYRSLGSGGTVTNADNELYSHATASGAARSSIIYIKGTNVVGAPKEYETARDSGVGVFGTSATNTLGAITHIRLFPQAGGATTFNGGRIYVIGRLKTGGGGAATPFASGHISVTGGGVMTVNKAINCSIIRRAVGVFSVNFTSPPLDAFYHISMMSRSQPTTNNTITSFSVGRNSSTGYNRWDTTGFDFVSGEGTTLFDPSIVSFQCFNI